MNVDRDACMSEVGSNFPTKIFTVTLACRPTESFLVLPPLQIIRRFGFSKYIAFAISLDVHYVQLHSKSNSNVSIKDKTSYNLERRKYFLF